MEVISDEEEMPHHHGVKVTYGVGSEKVSEIPERFFWLGSKAVFSFPMKEEAEKWMDDLNWRVQAIHRVYKYDDSDSEESATGGGTRRKTKRDKQAKTKFSLKKTRNVNKK